MPEPKKGSQFSLWWLILVVPKIFLTFILELLNIIKNTKAIYIYPITKLTSIYPLHQNQNPMRFFACHFRQPKTKKDRKESIASSNLSDH
jgi:hypothetical protein